MTEVDIESQKKYDLDLAVSIFQFLSSIRTDCKVLQDSKTPGLQCFISPEKESQITRRIQGTRKAIATQIELLGQKGKTMDGINNILDANNHQTISKEMWDLKEK